MIDPVPGGIRGEGKVSNGIPVDFVVEGEEDAEANACKGGVCGFGENVIVPKTFFSRRKFIRCQVLLDREMRKLYDSVAFSINDINETGTCRYYYSFCVRWPKFFVERWGVCRIETDCKNLSELLNAKWTNGLGEALEQTLGISSVYFNDAQ